MSQTDATSTKRQRISQACQTCRKRKSKCDGTRPECNVCSTNDRVCIYEDSSRKRGLQVGYVRGVEILLGLLVRELPVAESTLRKILRSTELQDTFFSPTFVELTADLWHESGLHEDIKRMLRHHEDGKQTSTASLSPIPGQQPLPSPTQTTLFSGNIACDNDAVIDHEVDECQVVDMHEDMIELIDWYFTHLHFLFPIVTRRDMLHVLHSEKNDSARTIRNHGHEACFYSVAALVVVSNNDNMGTHIKSEYLLQATASRTTAAESYREFGCIQAVLLLTISYVARGQMNAAWIKVGQVSRMLIAYMNEGLPIVDRFPHVLQACESLDILISTFLGKTPSSLPLQFPVIFLNEEGDEEWEGWRMVGTSHTLVNKPRRTALRALSIYNRTTQLMRHIRPFLSGNRDEIDIQTILTSIRMWKEALPPHCHFEESIMSNPCVVGLSLSYNFAIISVLLHVRCPAAEVLEAKRAANGVIHALHSHINIQGFTRPLIASYASHCIRCLRIYYSRDHDPEVRQLMTDLQDLQMSFTLDHSNTNINQPQVQDIIYPDAFSNFEHHDTYHQNSQTLRQTMDGCVDTLEILTEQPQADRMLTSTRTSTNSIPLTLSQRLHDAQMSQYQQFTGISSQSMEHHDDIDALTGNDFDDLLNEMAVDMDYPRSTTDDFAYNLGFLTRDLGPDLLAFLESAPDSAPAQAISS